jgi:16S rRNA (guanine527-N7)-methyltransferase
MTGVADQLARGIGKLGLAVTDTTQRQLLAYLGLVEKWNRVYNLTAVRYPADMVIRHVLDSLAVLPYVSARYAADIGSGAGLPGIPLAIMWPQTKFVLLDSNHKKTAFLQQAAIELELANVTVVCERVEAWKSQSRFDLVISRAFSRLPDFIKAAGRLCANDGVLAAMKGTRSHGEYAELPSGFKLEKIIPLVVPGLDEERHLVILKPH